MVNEKKRVPRLNLGLRMLIAMQTAGYGTGEMAKMLKVSRHSATGWLYGRHQPNHATLVRWAEICDVDLDWLVNGEEPLVTAGGGMSREQLAQALVAQLLGDKGGYPPGYNEDWENLVPDQELDNMPVTIDLRDRAVA